MTPDMLSVHHRLPSGPGVIDFGLPLTLYWVTAPDAVMRPTLPPLVNHSASSGPRVMALGEALPSEYSVGTPSVVIRPMRPSPLALTYAVYQRPPGPLTMPFSDMLGVAGGN